VLGIVRGGIRRLERHANRARTICVMRAIAAYRRANAPISPARKRMHEPATELREPLRRGDPRTCPRSSDRRILRKS
jgi:hypothetical protein